jgi:heat shock protein HtpX
MVSFQRLIAHNKRVSVLLFALTLALLGIMGASLGEYLDLGWKGGAGIAVVVAALYFLVAYNFGDSMVLAVSGAREITHDEHPQLWNVVEEMSIAGGLPMPKVYIMDSDALNAFATGKDPQHASVAITRGLLEKLNREELQGVMAHEMSHVRNYDIRFAMLMAVLVGVVVLLADVFRRSLFWGSLGGGRRRRGNDGGKGGAVLALVGVLFSIVAPLFAVLLQMAVSRKREYLADASAVELTRNPQGLISALQKLSTDDNKLVTASKATQHLYIVNPFRKLGADSLFSTHPSLESRIAALRGLATGGEAPGSSE